MKLFLTLIVLFGICNLCTEACFSFRRSRNKNPKIITTEPPVVTEAVQKPTEAVTTEGGAVATTQTAGNEAATEKPTQRETEAVGTTEAKQVDAKTELIDPLTRPTSIHKFVKQSAFVESNPVTTTCAQVNGYCKPSCDTNTEYLKGRFGCPSPTNCCVKRT